MVFDVPARLASGVQSSVEHLQNFPQLSGYGNLSVCKVNDSTLCLFCYRSPLVLNPLALRPDVFRQVLWKS